MSTRAFLVVALVVLLLALSSSGIGAVRRAPGFVRTVIDLLVIAAAVRIGLSIAIIAFDSTAANVAVPLACGIAAAALTFGRRVYAGDRS